MKKSFTNKQTSKKLAAYSAMAGALVLATTGVNGQIMYTDVDPDETYDTPGDFFELDLNMDGSVDFVFNIAESTVPNAFVTLTSGGLPGTVYFPGLIQRVQISPYNGSVAGSVVTLSGYSFGYPDALNNGADIDGSLSFTNLSVQSLALYVGVMSYPVPGSTTAFATGGNWTGKNDKFLGLLLEDGGNTFYGWARLDVDDNHHQFTIKDYAVHTAPDEMIEAGDGGSAIFSVIHNNELSAYSFNNVINVVVKDLHSTGATVKVFNVSGQVVYLNDLDMNGMTIELNDPTGNYTFQVVTKENAVYTKQLFINN